MTAFYKLLHVAAVAITVLLMGQTIAMVDACSCVDLSVCDNFEAADVVVHGTVLRRSGRRHKRRRSGNRDIKYTLEVTTVYKGDPEMIRDTQKISFTTERSESLCGVTLERGEEYLLGLYEADGKLTANSCGLVGAWSSITDEDKVSVEDACEDDPCNGTCQEFQECLFHSDQYGEQYYCADVCDPSPCQPGLECELKQLVQCFRDPCPPSAICS